MFERLGSEQAAQEVLGNPESASGRHDLRKEVKRASLCAACDGAHEGAALQKLQLGEPRVLVRFCEFVREVIEARFRRLECVARGSERPVRGAEVRVGWL